MDIKTIIFCLFIINLFLGIIILVIQQSHIDFKGFNFWTITNFMIATGYLFMGLRTKIPDFVSIVVANVLFLVAGIIRIYGFSFFFNRKIKRYQQVFLGMIFVIYLFVFFYFTYYQNSIYIRTCINGIAYSAITVFIGVLILKNKPAEEGSVYIFTSITYFVLSVISLARIITWTLHPSFQSLFNQSVINSLMFLSLMTIDISWTIMFLVMFNHKIKFKLTDSEERFRQLIDSSPQGIFVQTDKKFAFVNPATVKLLGANSSGSLLGTSILERCHPDFQKIVDERMQELNIHKKDVPRLDAIYLKLDGTPFDVSISSVPFNYMGKKGSLVYFSDITNKKQEEKILKQWENIFQYAKFGIAVVSASSDQLDLMNPEFARIHGYTVEELTGQSYGNVFTPEERDKLLTMTGMALEKGHMIWESMHCRKDGSTFPVFLDETTITDQHSKPLYRVVTLQDITLQKMVSDELVLAKEKVEESQQRLLTFINSIPDIVCYKDGNGRWLLTNEANLKLFSLQNVDYYGKTDSELSHYTNPLFQEAFINCMVTDERSWEVQSVSRGDEIFPSIEGIKKVFDVVKVPIYQSNGNRQGLAIIGRDITELYNIRDELIIAKEKAEESDRLKTAFLHNMSHEIRTPMNAIMGFSDLLVLNFNNKLKLEKFAEIIRLRCKDLLDLINDILDIAKIESGQLAINIEACSLKDLCEELTTFFTEHKKQINKQHIQFKFEEINPPLTNYILTDVVKLKQIFINLISNAFKFTEEGKIICGCKFDEEEGLLFYVSDTGIGIPYNKQDIVFERFTQLPHSSGRKAVGTGLGLSIVKGLIHLLGGKIWLTSEPDLGTTFYFTLPYQIAEELHKDKSPDTIQSGYDFSGKVVLIVEDDGYNADYLKEIISTTDLYILTASTGLEALETAITYSIDIVLMDIRLPDIDGYTVTKQIRQHKPNVIIIAQTAYASQDERQKALDAGCNDYISKPISRYLLLSIIKKWIL